ncbi:Flagellar biosynthesis protein FliP [Candidatus Rhodobacter oscarellae]|uniref:Flagellar biosynthesis protein FliP n=2 Tax=Candidatus Rhodobacter oscarellae TaxID=1675527 RepID=A0A0J9E0B9_9RHOB|nr:Flagellar biosynthesis protein FliP [Candidatus Rhodobacter lobularis]
MALPFAVVAMTSFIKIAIVLLVIRNALGIQQAPPNMALYTVALVLSVFIMAPMGDAILGSAAALEQDGGFQSLTSFIERGGVLLEPLASFLNHNTDVGTADLFRSRATTLWPEDFRNQLSEDSLLIMVPSFLLSELTNAFEISVLIYLPFAVVDLVVANILTAMGMMMVSPAMISMPFKLLLFVLVDGWYRLLDGLVLSYA